MRDLETSAQVPRHLSVRTSARGRVSAIWSIFVGRYGASGLRHHRNKYRGAGREQRERLQKDLPGSQATGERAMTRGRPTLGRPRVIPRRGEEYMIEIKIEEGDRLDWALKVFKRRIAKSGILKDLRKKRHY